VGCLAVVSGCLDGQQRQTDRQQHLYRRIVETGHLLGGNVRTTSRWPLWKIWFKSIAQTGHLFGGNVRTTSGVKFVRVGLFGNGTKALVKLYICWVGI
jgi:hypothetical protein